MYYFCNALLPTLVMKGKINYKDQKTFLLQAVNMFFSAVKLQI